MHQRANLHRINVIGVELQLAFADTKTCNYPPQTMLTHVNGERCSTGRRHQLIHAPLSETARGARLFKDIYSMGCAEACRVCARRRINSRKAAVYSFDAHSPVCSSYTHYAHTHTINTFDDVNVSQWDSCDINNYIKNHLATFRLFRLDEYV